MPYQPALSAEDIINKTRSELIRSHGQALGQLLAGMARC